MITKLKISFLTILILFSVCPHFVWADTKEYGINEPDKVHMSYRFEGGESPYRYVQVDINNDNGRCAYEYQGDQEKEYTSNAKLPLSFVQDMIKAYNALNFYNLDVKNITLNYPDVIDAGINTIEFEYGEHKHQVSYGIIKTNCIGNMCLPVSITAKRLQSLQEMYWKIINQEEYVSKLKDYRSQDAGSLANLLSSLAADVSGKRVLNPKVFVPLIIQIISDEKQREILGQYAALALERIVGNAPKGDWWDCEKWLVWWQEHKKEYENH